MVRTSVSVFFGGGNRVEKKSAHLATHRFQNLLRYVEKHLLKNETTNTFEIGYINRCFSLFLMQR